MGVGHVYVTYTAQLDQLVRPWEDDSSPVSYSVNIMGQSYTYCNDIYRDTFLTGQAELDEFNAKHLYSPFLWGRAICPGDHQAFFAAVAKASYAMGSQAADSSLVVKALTRAGKEFLGLVRFRSFYSSIGLSHAFSIMTIPPSCHSNPHSPRPSADAVLTDLHPLLPTSDDSGDDGASTGNTQADTKTSSSATVDMASSSYSPS